MDKKWKKIGIALICVTVLGGAGITIATMNQPKESSTQVSKKTNTNDASKGKTSKKVIEQAKGDEKKEQKGTIGSVSGQEKPKSSLSAITGGNWQKVDRSPVANTLAAIDKQIEQKKVDEKKKEAPKVPTKTDPIVSNENKPIPTPEVKPIPEPKPDPKPEPTPTPEVNYQVLARLLQSAQQIDSTHYTPNSYQGFASEIAVAAQMLQEKKATQGQVDGQVVRLQEAINRLVKKAEKHVLAEWLATANTIDRSLYTTGSVALLDQAASHAERILADGNSSQSIVDDAATQLQQAVDQLVKRGDKTPLYALVTTANAIDRELYTEESVAVLDQALQQANRVLSNGDATEGDIQQACQHLQTGLDQLNKKEDPAYTIVRIKRLLAECDQLNAEEYTEDSFTALKEEMNKAKALVDRPNVTTQEANEQLQALQSAKKKLVKRAEKKALVAILDEVSRLQSQEYTPESWGKLMTAKKGSQQLLEDSNATQQQIDAKVKEIRTAIDQLQPSTKE